MYGVGKLWYTYIEVMSLSFSDFFQSSMPPTDLVGDTLEDHMQMYESLWRKTSDEREDQELPSTFDFGEHEG